MLFFPSVVPAEAAAEQQEDKPAPNPGHWYIIFKFSTSMSQIIKYYFTPCIFLKHPHFTTAIVTWSTFYHHIGYFSFSLRLITEISLFKNSTDNIISLRWRKTKELREHLSSTVHPNLINLLISKIAINHSANPYHLKAQVLTNVAIFKDSNKLHIDINRTNKLESFYPVMSEE